MADSLTATLAVPDVPLEPLQPPLPIQLVAFVELQENWTAPPGGTLLVLATKIMVGERLAAGDDAPVPAGAIVGGGVEALDGGARTVTLRVLVTVPPWPLQVKVYCLEEVKLPVEKVPAVPFSPLQLPEASQVLAFITAKCSSAEAP